MCPRFDDNCPAFTKRGWSGEFGRTLWQIAGSSICHLCDIHQCFKLIHRILRRPQDGPFKCSRLCCFVLSNRKFNRHVLQSTWSCVARHNFRHIKWFRSLVAVFANYHNCLLHFRSNELFEQSVGHFQYQHCHTNLLCYIHYFGDCCIGNFIQRMAPHDCRKCDWRFVRILYCHHCCHSSECLPKCRNLMGRSTSNDASTTRSNQPKIEWRRFHSTNTSQRIWNTQWGSEFCQKFMTKLWRTLNALGLNVSSLWK